MVVGSPHKAAHTTQEHTNADFVNLARSPGGINMLVRSCGAGVVRAGALPRVVASAVGLRAVGARGAVFVGKTRMKRVGGRFVTFTYRT